MFMRATKRVGVAPMRGKALGESETTFHTLVETIATPIFISRGGRLHYVNRAAEAITGYTREELLSMSFRDLVHLGSADQVMNPGRAREEEIGLASRCEVRILTKDHQERWIDITAARFDFDGVPAMLFSAFDLTARKQTEELAQILAVTDPLTGLGNYRRLLDVLDAEVKRSERTERPFAVLLLDLDGLKKINDRYGHLTGSRALCRLGEAVQASCRVIDTAARYGGDEFAVVLPEATARAAELVASRIHDRLSANREQPPISASIGLAVYPQDGETIEALLGAADREVYWMKSRGAEKHLRPAT